METEDSVQAFLEFYEKIPDYADLNHLSDREFYLKVQQLKTKQKNYVKDMTTFCNEDLECNYVKNKEILHKKIGKHSKTPFFYSKYNQKNLDVYGRKCYLNDKTLYATPKYPTVKKGLSSKENISLGEKLERERISCFPIEVEDTTKNDRSSCLKCSAGGTNLTSDNEYQESKVGVVNNKYVKNNDSAYPKTFDKSSKTQNKKLTKNRDLLSASVLIGKSCSSLMDSAWDSLGIEDYIPETELCYGSDSGQDEILDLHCSYSVPNSPALKHSKTVEWQAPKLTVPKPFRMTLREEEERNLNALRYQLLSESVLDERKEDSNIVKANPVPLESRVPLFDKIMAEQENRRRRVRQQCINQLKSQMKPFKFVKRDEDKARWRLCYSSPDLRTNVSSPKPQPFRARPVPKNLFSVEAYRRLYEDEFYRALKKKIRAEEMLRSSSLPPSMAAREKMYKIKAMSAEALNCASDKKKRKKSKIPNCVKNHAIMRELEESSNENGSTPESTKLKTTGQHKVKSARFHSPDNSSISSRYEMYLSPSPSDTIYTRSPSALGIPRNRNNLASVLRIQTARQRIEKELAAKQEEMKRKEQIKRKARVTRCKPAWQALNYSTEEDLELRVQTRREEERIRREEYERYMELMYGRVQRIPTLFERQSQMNQRLREKSLRKSRGRMGSSLRVTSSPTTPDLYEEEEEEEEEQIIDEAERSDISEDKESKVGLKVSISETPETIECSSEHGYENKNSAVRNNVEERTPSGEKATETEEPKEGNCIEEKEKDENESLESIEEEVSSKNNGRETAEEG